MPRRWRGMIGGRFSGGAPRPSGAGSTRQDGGLSSRDDRSGALDEAEGESGIGSYISLATSSMNPG